MSATMNLCVHFVEIDKFVKPVFLAVLNRLSLSEFYATFSNFLAIIPHLYF